MSSGVPRLRAAGERPLAQQPCRQLCDWSATGESIGELPVFACAGCGSEWIRSEGWTPRQWDGTQLAVIEAEAARRRRDS